jgi:hypothetical protein
MPEYEGSKSSVKVVQVATPPPQPSPLAAFIAALIAFFKRLFGKG